METEDVGVAINIAILWALSLLTWWLPQKWGPLGLLAVHLLAAVSWIAMGAIALEMGIWPQYDNPLVIIGLLVQALLFNCAMLPLGIWAVYRWQRHLRNCRDVEKLTRIAV